MSANYSRYEQGGYGDDGLPDYIYYNGDVINNRTDDYDDAGKSYLSPLIQFNETRDAALVKDASKYHFSIVRFAMNGPGKAIPIFIPSIQTGTTQINNGITTVTANTPASINLTNYGAVIAFTQSYSLVGSDTNTYTFTFQITPPLTYMTYVSEFVGNTIVAPTPNLPVTQQDLNPQSKYYNVYSYNNVVSMINATFASALNQTWVRLNAAYLGLLQNPPSLTAGSPYAVVTVSPALPNGITLTAAAATSPLVSYSRFIGSAGASASPSITAVTVPPQLVYDSTAYLFSYYFPTSSYVPPNTARKAFTPPAGSNATSLPTTKLFVNTNMFGLIGNLPFNYVNAPLSNVFGLGNLTLTEGYAYELQPYSNFFSNIIVNTGNNSVPDGTSNFTPTFITPNYQQEYWVCQQDFKTIDTLWSPVASIVFTTGLIPIRAEATGQPVITGTSNTSLSAPTSQSAFQPIITDVVLPMSDGAADYNGFVYYTPTSEYRMSSLANSPIDIRSIDLQVFYRNRLNNTLYPITMFNLSNVSFKIMFRHKRLGHKC